MTTQSLSIEKIKSFTKPELKLLIDQLETAMQDFLKAKNIEKATQLQELIGKCIDLYNEDNPEYKNFFLS